MSQTELLPCPFCGMEPPEDLIDTLYPGTYWREDDGFRQYLPHTERAAAHGMVWTMHCTQNMGGCGAQISGDSKREAIAAWNRRSSSLLLDREEAGGQIADKANVGSSGDRPESLAEADGGQAV